MRLATLALALAGLLAASAPAAAQLLNPDLRLSQMEARQQAQDQLDRQRGVAQQNELMSLDAQIRTEQRLTGVQVQSNLPVPPDATYTEGTPIPIPRSGRSSQIVSIPDADLAASNARVEAAAANRD
jgi:hypothetical protein